VNAVAPGFVATDMTADLSEGAAKELHDSIPLGRIGTPDDVAAVVEFLIGPGGDYITGQVIVVDGGLSL
jgi:3-oxoacyl-[acyl-carrier protein] reductase